VLDGGAEDNSSSGDECDDGPEVLDVDAASNGDAAVSTPVTAPPEEAADEGDDNAEGPAFDVAPPAAQPDSATNSVAAALDPNIALPVEAALANAAEAWNQPID